MPNPDDLVLCISLFLLELGEDRFVSNLWVGGQDNTSFPGFQQG